MKPSKNHTWKVGDLARNVESGWLGRIIRLHEPETVWVDRVGGRSFTEQMATLVGVNELCMLIGGLSVDQAIDEDDHQQHAMDDLAYVGA